MTFLAELEAARQEVRKGASGPVCLWPKFAGANVEVTSATAVLFNRSGASLGALAVTNALEGSPSVSRLSVTVDASGLELAEDHRVDFTMTYAGQVNVISVGFDVVVEPLGTVGVSLNDLVSEVAEMAGMLRRQAQQQDDGRTAEQQAQTLATKSTQDLRIDLKRLVQQRGGSWPRYLVNQDDLRPVVVAGAILRAFVAQGLTTDAQRQQEAYWREERDRRLSRLPALRFSTDEDRVPDDEVTGMRVVRLRRL